MDKTHQLLESLKASVDPSSATSAAAAAITPTPGSSLSNALDMMTAVGSSLINNPLFYVKVVAVLIITVMIVMISISLITDG